MVKRRDFLRLAVCGAAGLRFGPIWAAEAPVHARTLFWGASAYALGYASARPEDTVIVDDGIVFAPEFSAAFGPNALGKAESPLTRSFAAELLRRRIAFKDGTFHTPLLTDFAAVWSVRRNLNVLLNASFIACEKKSDGLACTFLGPNGRELVCADTVVDTSAEGWRNLGADRVKRKRLAASYLRKDGSFIAEVPPCADWHTARLALHEAADRAGVSGTLAAEASYFIYDYKTAPVERIHGDVIWHPGAQYTELLTAFEKGAAR